MADHLATARDIQERIERLVEPACASNDPLVVKAGIVLAALAGCMSEPIDSEDQLALDSLARMAGTICEHRLGRHR